jgi:S1-C subfamily serine protease
MRRQVPSRCRLVIGLSLLLIGGCVPAPTAADVGGGHTDARAAVAPSAVAVAADVPAVRAESLERMARRMTVRVRSRGCGRIGTASAVAVGRRLLVTNRHVVAGADSIELNYWDGTSAEARLDTVAVGDDLALVEVSLRLPAVARLAEADAPEGSPMLVVGFPNGGEQKIVRGELIEYAPLEQHPDASMVMRLATPVAPGNSGGPVLDRSGTVVGVVFGIETATGHGLAVPSSAVRQLIEHRDAGGPAPGCL